MGKLMAIHEPDLQTLEELVPPILERLQSLDFAAHGKANQNEIRAKMRRIQEILVNVRWNYGPHEIVEQFPADDPMPEEETRDE